MRVCVGWRVLEIHWQKTNTHMQIGSALKTNVLCIDIALFLSPLCPSQCLQLIVTEVSQAHALTHAHTYTHTPRSEYNINIQFKLLPNWLSQISIMHLLHSLHSRLKVADVANFHTIHTHTHTYIYSLHGAYVFRSSISNLICQSFLFCSQSTNPSSGSLDLPASHN